jgi:AbiV family abortive infection protein
MDSYQDARSAIGAALDNARALLTAARALLDAGQPARLAYHFAALALEEVGKASILGMRAVRAARDRDLPSVLSDETLQDHVRKLFWAIWGPTIGRDVITGKQIEEIRGLAQQLHIRRMQGLYVDSSEDGVSLPVGSISAGEAMTLIGMAEARLELERSIDFDTEPSPEGQDRAVWLFEATSDPERRALIMGHKSMQKLAELGSTSAWVTWLKETFEKHEAETRALIEREMRRSADDPATATDKWLIVIRLYTESNSIRQKDLNRWNEGIRWIKLRAVSGKKDQLLLDLSATSEVTLENVWRMGLTMGRRVVMALNISTLGYFWFHPPLDDARQSGRYYDRVQDISSGNEIRAQRGPALRLDFGARKRVLDERALNRAQLCMAILLNLRTDDERNMVERYLEGMAFIAKTDVQMSFELQGAAAFYMCAQLAMSAYGDWSRAEPFPDALRRMVKERLPEFDDADLEKLTGVGEAVAAGRPIPVALTMNEVGLMKAICDVYFLHTFGRIEPERLGADSAGETAQPNPGKRDH